MNESSAIVEMLERRRLPVPPVRRALRLSAGATQEEVAEALGITGAAVSRYESGEREPRGDLRLRYARLLRGLEEAAG